MSGSPAGLYSRSVAWSIDAALLMPLVLLLSWGRVAPAAAELGLQANSLLVQMAQSMAAAILAGTGPALLSTQLLQDAAIIGAVAAVRDATWALLWPPAAVFALVGALYHGALDASAWQGSAGKRLLGLRVHDIHGARLQFGRAVVRHVAASLSWLTFNLGHAMAALGPTHATLHDRCTGTAVAGRDGALPAWTLAWMALLAASAFAVLVWSMTRSVTAMQRVLEQALY